MSNSHQNEININNDQMQEYSDSEERNTTEGSNTIRIIHDQLPPEETEHLQEPFIPPPTIHTQDFKSTKKGEFIEDDDGENDDEYDREIQNHLSSKEMASYVEAVKESIEELYEDKLLELQEEHENEKNTLMQLVETLKSDNERLTQELKNAQKNAKFENQEENFVREEIEEYYKNEFKELEQQLIEKFKEDTENYMHKLDTEMQEILITKGITKDRMREIEEEVRSEMEKHYESTRKSESGKDLEFNQNDIQNSLDFKVALRTEIQKKERLLEVNFKKKLRNETDKMKAKLELEFQEKEKSLRKEIEDEKLEFSRRKSTFNIRSKKLVETKKKLEKEMSDREKKHQKVVKELKKKLERVVREKDEVIEKSEKVFEKSAKDFNRKISEEGQEYEEEAETGTLPNFGVEELDENDVSDYGRLNSAIDARIKQDNLLGDRHTFGITQENRPLYPITESGVKRAEENFGMENSDIFKKLINEKPKLLSHQENSEKKNMFNQEYEEDYKQIDLISDRSPFHSEFRQANMVDLEDTRSNNYFSKKEKNGNIEELENSERNLQENGQLKLREGTMKNLADELIERYLSNSGGKGMLGVNLSEHLGIKNKIRNFGVNEDRVKKIDISVVNNEESLDQLTRDLLSRRKKNKAKSMMKINQNENEDLSRMIEENSYKVKENYFKSNMSHNFSQNDSILNKDFNNLDPQIYKHKHSKTYHGEENNKKLLESYMTKMKNQRQNTEIKSKKKLDNNPRGNYLNQILKHAEIEHGLQSVLNQENEALITSKKSKFSNNLIFDKIFKLKKKDSTKVKAMKSLREEIEEFRLQDNILLPKVIGKISYLSSDFIQTLAGYSNKDPGKKQYISELFLLLEKIWKEIFMSYEGKLDFLTTLEKCNELGDFASRLKLEIDYLNDYKLKNSKILSLLKKREMLKAQILTIANNYKEKYQIGEMNKALSSCSTILRRTLKDMIKQVDLIRRQKRDMVTYKGVPSDTLLRMDYWELEFLKKCEGRYSKKIGYASNY